MVVQKVGFFAMLQGLYGTLNAMFSAVQRMANAADNLGQWAEESTATFVDEARIEREEKLDELKRKRMERQAKALAAPQPVTDVEVKQ